MNDAARRKLFDEWFSGPPMNGDREALIRKSGYTKGRISQFFDPEQQFGERAARSLAQRLGLPAEFFNTPSIVTANVRMTGVDLSPDHEGVPLLTWARARDWHKTRYHDPEATEYLPCPAAHGPDTYCLRVSGDSMHNPAGRPSYDDGDVIFVDPDRIARPGDRVIVRLGGHAAATFKQLVLEDGRQLLKALNPEWRPRYMDIDEAADIVGVVIGKWVPE